MVAQYIATRPILDLCDWSAQRTGVWLSRWWWEQDRLDLEGTKNRAATESDGYKAISEEEGMPNKRLRSRNEDGGVQSSKLIY